MTEQVSSPPPGPRPPSNPKAERLFETVNGYIPLYLGDEGPLAEPPNWEIHTEALVGRIYRDLTELFARACTEDLYSLEQFQQLLELNTVRSVKLAEQKAEFVRQVARRSFAWPALVTTNNADIERAIAACRDLEVGKEFVFDNFNRKSLDLAHPWVQYAWGIIRTLAWQRMDDRILEITSRGTFVEKRHYSFSHTRLTTFIYHYHGRFVGLAEWAIRCHGLGTKPTAFKDLWELGKLVILEYWQRNPKRYHDALSLISYDAATTEGRKRQFALNAIRNAMLSVLKQRKPSVVAKA